MTEDDFSRANLFAGYFLSIFQGDDGGGCFLPPKAAEILNIVHIDVPAVFSAIHQLNDKTSYEKYEKYEIRKRNFVLKLFENALMVGGRRTH